MIEDLLRKYAEEFEAGKISAPNDRLMDLVTGTLAESPLQALRDAARRRGTKRGAE